MRYRRPVDTSATDRDDDTERFEEVDFDRPSWSNRVLYLPGECFLVHGVIRAIRCQNPSSASLISVGGDAMLVERKRERSSPDGGDGPRTRVRLTDVGDKVEPGDRSTGTALVVEYHPPRASLFPLPLLLASLSPTKLFGTLSPQLSQVVGRVFMVFVIIGIVLVGTGSAAPGNIERFLDDRGINGVLSDLRNDDPKLSPPTVTMTSPPPPTPNAPSKETNRFEDPDIPTPASTSSTATTLNPPPSSPTPAPAPASSLPPTTTVRTGTGGGVEGDGDGSGGGGSGGGGRGGDFGDSRTTTTAESLVSPDLTLTVEAADPATIRNVDGAVGALSGPVVGTLSWIGTTDSVVLVVNAWVPDDDQQEERRVTLRESSPVDITAVLGSDVTYAEENRTAGFAATDDDETTVTTGYVSVTAMFFRDSTGVARIEETASPDATVESTAGSIPAGVDFELGSGGADVSLLDTQSVAPSSVGNSTGVPTNRGCDPGVLTPEPISSEFAENDRFGPELAVDSVGRTDEGELRETLAVRLRVERANGTSSYTFENETTHLGFADVWNKSVSFGRLDGRESPSLVAEQQTREAAGNEIQTDSINAEFVFALEQTVG